MTNSTAKLFFIQLGKDIKQGFEECFAFCVPKNLRSHRISPRSICDIENQVTNDLNNKHTDVIVDEYGIPINIETSDIETSDIETGDIETSDIETSDIETSYIETSDIENQLVLKKKQILPISVDNIQNKNLENDYIVI